MIPGSNDIVVRRIKVRMKLYIMRHGETDNNQRNTFQGRKDTPLNETGKKQAREAGKVLAGISFDACYTSPLIRARQTAELATGWERDKLIIEERIIEISFGVMEGTPVSQLSEEQMTIFTDPEKYCPPEGGESFEEVIARVKEFLEELKQASYENVLVVSHGAAIHAMLLVLHKRPLKEFWLTDVGNCGVTEVSLIEGEWKITKECETEDPYYGKAAKEKL